MGIVDQENVSIHLKVHVAFPEPELTEVNTVIELYLLYVVSSVPDKIS